MSVYSVIGAVIFLAIGVVELAVLNRVLYPALRWRFEKAKVTQSQGMEPNRIMTLVKIQSLIIMPVIGLFLGDRMKALFG
ncbi:MAG: hypothetical protein KDK22_08425 [Rhodobacteraceae bacterium]|nr:hypothetical protein [Paracoccaceae bacterium]